jgi:hypothetical protein
MAERYSDRIRQYCERHGIAVPAAFDRHPASRYAIIELSQPPRLVARTWFKVEDLIYYLDRQAEVPRRIVDFKRAVVLEREGKARMRAVGQAQSG